jgi:hypothetical protein
LITGRVVLFLYNENSTVRVVQMKKTSSRTCLSIVYLLAAGLSASPVVYADWSGDKLYKGYNQRYGDFPPTDIDEQLSDATKETNLEASKTDKAVKEDTAPANPAAATANSKPAVAAPAQATGTQPLQQPAYGNYYQNGYYAPPGMPQGMRGYDRRSAFSNPWNSRGSRFTGPWNNRGSSFGTPWNSRGSGYRGPWNNNGSSFSAPWNNNRSGFRPWGNGGSWGW